MKLKKEQIFFESREKRQLDLALTLKELAMAYGLNPDTMTTIARQPAFPWV